MESFKVITSDIVKIDISNSGCDAVCLQRRFAKDITVGDFKVKLEMITGGNSATMKLELYSKENKLVGTIDNDDTLLGSFPIDDGMRVHVVDNFNFSSENVEKFELTKDEYAKRPNTVKSFLQMNKLGIYNAEEMKLIEAKRDEDQKEEIAQAAIITVGARCQVKVKGQPLRKGIVMYNGNLEKENGLFIGIKYDLPLGKNDGTFKDVRYFTCPPKYGGFVKPNTVEVGNFPEDDFDLDDEL